MENVYDVGRVSYVPAERAKVQTFYEKFSFSLNLLGAIIKVLVLSVPCFLAAIYRLVVKPSRKCISGQTALVTGGGNGIGREIAIRLASEGCNVAVADLDFEAAKKTAKELNEMNVIARAYLVDITDTDEIKKLKVDIENDISAVDILVNNAGIVPKLSLREGADKDVERIITVNVTAHIHVTRAFLPGMIDRKRGHILGMASMSAIHPMGGAVVYATTKGAIHNFMIGLNEEMREEGNECIKCTSILPYIVATRKDISDNAAPVRFPLITPEFVAEVAVDAMLRNEFMITVPRYYLAVTRFIQLLPLSVQVLFRDIILKKKGTTK